MLAFVEVTPDYWDISTEESLMVEQPQNRKRSFDEMSQEDKQTSDALDDSFGFCDSYDEDFLSYCSDETNSSLADSRTEAGSSNSSSRASVPEDSEYVRMCKLFKRENDEELDINLVLRAMRAEFPSEYTSWVAMINSPDSPRRQEFIKTQCKSSNIREKLLFTLLQCVEYTSLHPRGISLWQHRSAAFNESFQRTIYRMLFYTSNSEKYLRRNPFLLSSLQCSSVFINFLYESMSLNRNLCFLLCVVSCVEGRGKYHGRTARNLSVPHKCYRYLIETLGGDRKSVV